jgi:hypothetical protein
MVLRGWGRTWRSRWDSYGAGTTTLTGSLLTGRVLIALLLIGAILVVELGGSRGQGRG